MTIRQTHKCNKRTSEIETQQSNSAEEQTKREKNATSTIHIFWNSIHKLCATVCGPSVSVFCMCSCVRAVRWPKRDVNESNLKLLLTHHCVCMCTTLFYPLYPLNIGGMVMCVSRLYILAIRSWYCRVFFSRISWQRCDEEWMEIQTHALTLTYTQYQSSTHRQTRMARYYEYMFREFSLLYVRHMTTVELCSDMATAIEKCSAHRDAIKSTLYKALRLKLGIVRWMRNESPPWYVPKLYARCRIYGLTRFLSCASHINT